MTDPRKWFQLLVGLAIGAAGAFLLWTALERPPEFLARAASPSVLPMLAVGMVAIGLAAAIIWRHTHGVSARRFVWAGLLMPLAGLLGMAASTLSPDELSIQKRQQNCLIVAVDISDIVLFPDEDGRRIGADLDRRNALFAAILRICEHADAQVLARNPGVQRPSFEQWLRKNWRVLLNWEPAPPPPARFDQPLAAELWFFDARSCFRVETPGAPLADTLRAALRDSDKWDSHPPGMAPEASRILNRGPGAVVWLITPADVNAAAQGEAWKAMARDASAELSTILLPSPTRSSYPDRRQGAKADVAAGGARGVRNVMWLGDRPLAGEWEDLKPGNLLPDAESRQLAAALDPQVSLGRPRDMDELRRRFYGPEAAQQVQQNSSQLRAELEKLLLPVPATSAPSPQPARHGQLMAAILCLALALVAILIPHRTALLDVHAPAPRFPGRLTVLVASLAAVGAVVVGLWWFWPGAQWQFHSRPAMILWSAAASVSVLLVWPALFRSLRLGDSAWRAWLAVSWMILAIALPPALGIAFRPAMPWAGTLLLPMAILWLALLWPSRPNYEAAGEDFHAVAQDRWAHGSRWTPPAMVVSLAVALLVAGLVEFPGGVALYRRILAGILLAFGILCLAGASFPLDLASTRGRRASHGRIG